MSTAAAAASTSQAFLFSQNCRLLLRAIYYAASREDEMKKYYVTNVETEAAAFENAGRICVINNSKQPQRTEHFYKRSEEMQLGNETYGNDMGGAFLNP